MAPSAPRLPYSEIELWIDPPPDGIHYFDLHVEAGI
jgi:hypothetical protein